MADDQEKLLKDTQKKVGKDWQVFQATAYTRPEQVQGEYRAHRYIPNGTLVEVFGGTPEELAKAAADYDALAESKETPAERAERHAASEKQAEGNTERLPQTEAELAATAVETTPDEEPKKKGESKK